MKTTLSKRTAQKIVDTIKDVCGCNINFIHPDGTIFASTNKSRIGTYHEVAKQVAQSRQTIEITMDNRFLGTMRGINIPFYYHQELIAIIGLTGTPDEVRPFALLAQKVTSLILKEQEIGSVNERKKTELNYVLNSLIDEEKITPDSIETFLSPYHVTLQTRCRALLFEPRIQTDVSNVSYIEQHVYRFFDSLKTRLYTFNYPNEYLLILPETQYQRSIPLIHHYANQSKEFLKIGVGNCVALQELHFSYNSAKIALESVTKTDALGLFEELDIEFLLGSLTEDIKQEYMQKTVDALSEEDMQLLDVYFSHEMSLKGTAEALYLHKNTVQYQLNRIEGITGYNPRKFQDAVRLWVGVKLRG